MKKQIPLHHHRELSGNGIILKIVSHDEDNHHPIDYAHRDDYYIFGIIVRGNLTCDIDFKRQNVKEGELQFIKPGQVHRFVNSNDFKGLMLMAESSLVIDRYKLIFDEVSVMDTPATISDTELNDLKSLFALMYGLSGNEVDLCVMQNLVLAFIGLVAACFQRSYRQNPYYNSRHAEIFMQFNSLLQTHISTSHRPSFYADRLHISSVYLNEVVKNISGWSVSNYIRNEIVLHAKRMLYYTTMAVKEIAAALGFDDYAYFSRLFTKASGKSPLNFRQGFHQN